MSGKAIHDDMLATLGDNAPVYSVVKIWLAKFKRGRNSVKDEHCSPCLVRCTCVVVQHLWSFCIVLWIVELKVISSGRRKLVPFVRNHSRGMTPTTHHHDILFTLPTSPVPCCLQCINTVGLLRGSANICDFRNKRMTKITGQMDITQDHPKGSRQNGVLIDW